MSELNSFFRRNTNTGKLDIVIRLNSSPDALPSEHEQIHRALVEKLIVIGKGVKPEDIGELIVEREQT